MYKKRFFVKVGHTPVNIYVSSAARRSLMSVRWREQRSGLRWSRYKRFPGVLRSGRQRDPSSVDVSAILAAKFIYLSL